MVATSLHISKVPWVLPADENGMRFHLSDMVFLYHVASGKIQFA
jgi:hypothetical protein